MEFVFILTLLVGCAGLFICSARKIFDAPGVYILHALGLMLPPAIAHIFGYRLPDAYYDIAVEHAALLKLSAIAALSFSGTIAGYMFFKRYPVGAFLFPKYNHPISHYMTMFGIVALTILSAAVIFIPLKAAGFNIVRAIDLVRHEFFFEGAAYLRQFQFFANFISGGFLVYLLQKRKTGQGYGRLMLCGVALLFVFNLLMSALMGWKAMIVFPLAFTILAYEVCVARKGMFRLAISGALILATVVSLQFMRSELVQGAQKPAGEHVYVGLYFVLYDSTLLYLDTQDKKHFTEMGQDFIAGLTAPIPRALWAGKPEREITVGGRFKAQVVGGEATGGWPVYGFAQWYVNFGWVGVFIGGLLTGWLLAIVQARYADYRENPFSFLILWNAVFLVMGPWPGGVHSFFVSHYVLFILPLFIFKFFTKRSLLNIP